MATYNGARHLREQIDSILAQTDHDWTLFVHDDGSADDTVAILHEYAAAHRQVVVLDYPPTGGACANFLGMMQRVEAQYYLFADQDDVWLSDKVRLSREEMLRQEAAHPQAPVVVHTDLVVADEQLNVVAPSFMKYTATRLGFHIYEVPIVFTDRVLGTSKMSMKIFKEAFFGVFNLRFRNWRNY